MKYRRKPGIVEVRAGHYCPSYRHITREDGSGSFYSDEESLLRDYEPISPGAAGLDEAIEVCEKVRRGVIEEQQGPGEIGFSWRKGMIAGAACCLEAIRVLRWQRVDSGAAE